MITSHHDNLNTSRTAFGDGVRYSSPGRINQRDETHKTESMHGEVAVFRVEGETNRVLVSWKHIVAESEYTFSKATKFKISVIESFLHILVKGLVFTININGGASFKNSLRSALHNQQVSGVTLVFGFVNRYLVLVGGIERSSDCRTLNV